MTMALDAQRTQSDQRPVHRAGRPGAGVPPDPTADPVHDRGNLAGRVVPRTGTGSRPACSATSPAAMSVGELLARAGVRDPLAWEEILRRYGGLVRARVRSLRLQDADAVDAVQMTWVRLAENCDRIDHPDRLGGWLTTTAYREGLRILRSTRQTARSVDGVADPADPAAGPERTVLDTETAAVVRALVAELPPRSRTIIQAMFADETCAYAEISRVTGIPIGSLGPTRARALHQLRRMLTARGLGCPA